MTAQGHHYSQFHPSVQILKTSRKNAVGAAGRKKLRRNSNFGATMSWNHRVVRHLFTRVIGKKPSPPEEYFAIHEVYYDDNDKPEGVTKDPVHPQGSTPEELRMEIVRFLRACDEPILDYEKDFKGKNE